MSPSKNLDLFPSGNAQNCYDLISLQARQVPLATWHPGDVSIYL